MLKLPAAVFSGRAVLAPCEITPGFTGYLVGNPGQGSVRAELDRSRLTKSEKLSLLQMLNPQPTGSILFHGTRLSRDCCGDCDGS